MPKFYYCHFVTIFPMLSIQKKATADKKEKIFELLNNTIFKICIKIQECIYILNKVKVKNDKPANYRKKMYLKHATFIAFKVIKHLF